MLVARLAKRSILYILTVDLVFLVVAIMSQWEKEITA